MEYLPSDSSDDGNDDALGVGALDKPNDNGKVGEEIVLGKKNINLNFESCSSSRKRQRVSSYEKTDKDRSNADKIRQHHAGRVRSFAHVNGQWPCSSERSSRLPYVCF